MNPLYVGAAAILASGLAWTVGNIQGRSASQIACERQKVTESVSALQDYRAAVDAQSAQDRAQSLADQAAIQKATDRIAETARRFERIKVQAVPVGNCVLSAEWVKAYDEAR